MADQEEISEWIAENAEELDLQVTRLIWTDLWLPGYASVTASVLVDGQRYIGYGIDRNADVAVVKSVVESIERSLKYYNELPNTSGIAGHTNVDQACLNAQGELVERDAFFCHYLSGFPMVISSTWKTLIGSDIDIAKIDCLLREVGIELVMADMAAPNGWRAFCCIGFGENASPKPFGVIVGLGCHRQAHVAVQKAFLECLTNVVAKISGSLPEPMTEHDFNLHPSPSVYEHLRVGLDPDTAPLMRKLVSNVGGIPYASLDLDQIMLRPLAVPEIFRLSPLTFYRATSSSAQTAFFGRLSDSVININRLKSFTNQFFTMTEQLVCYPHPLP